MNRDDAPPPFDGFGGHDDALVWEAIARWRALGRHFALLTVTATRGFTPRKAATHMLLDEDGEMLGTIGGGAIEHEALAAARDLLAQGGTSVTVHRHLTQELGMCCGGEMTVHVEAIVPLPRLWIFGAGYLSRALAPLAAGCGFLVGVVDERDGWARAEHFPGAQVHCRGPLEFVREGNIVPRDYVVVVTHDHALDQRLVETLLASPPCFLGMIGSLPKQRKFVLRLRARGFTAADIARLRTPLGIAIGAATPEEIAISVMAEIIAARRGVEIGPLGTTPVRHGEERRPRGGAVTPASAEVLETSTRKEVR